MLVTMPVGLWEERRFRYQIILGRKITVGPSDWSVVRL